MVNNFGFTGTKGVKIEDPLFIYVEWDDDYKPSNTPQLRDLIENLDLEHFSNSEYTISNSLPFLTFKQAEILFRGLRDKFEYFWFKGIALATQVNDNGKLTGKASIENSPQVVPFEIYAKYDNLVIPIIEATFRDERFQNYSYDELARYFCDVNYNLMDCYGKSLGLSRSEFPYFPLAGTIEGELPRKSAVKEQVTPKRTAQINPKAKSNGKVRVEDLEHNNKDVIFKITAIIALLLSVFLVVFTVMLTNKTISQEKKLEYLYSKTTEIQDLQTHEHSADTFGKFFLAYYFAGNRDELDQFLSDGDAKYTQPETGTVSSLTLNDFTKDDDEYTLSYVVTYRDENDTLNTKTFTFNCIPKEKSQWHWLVTSEPIIEDYIDSDENN